MNPAGARPVARGTAEAVALNATLPSSVTLRWQEMRTIIAHQKKWEPARKQIAIYLLEETTAPRRQRRPCWHSQEKIAHATNRDLKTVQRECRALKALGMISIEQVMPGGRLPDGATSHLGCLVIRVVDTWFLPGPHRDPVPPFVPRKADEERRRRRGVPTPRTSKRVQQCVQAQRDALLGVLRRHLGDDATICANLGGPLEDVPVVELENLVDDLCRGTSSFPNRSPCANEFVPESTAAGTDPSGTDTPPDSCDSLRGEIPPCGPRSRSEAAAGAQASPPASPPIPPPRTTPSRPVAPAAEREGRPTSAQAPAPVPTTTPATLEDRRRAVDWFHQQGWSAGRIDEAVAARGGKRYANSSDPALVVALAREHGFPGPGQDTPRPDRGAPVPQGDTPHERPDQTVPPS